MDIAIPRGIRPAMSQIPRPAASPPHLRVAGGRDLTPEAPVQRLDGQLTVIVPVESDDLDLALAHAAIREAVRPLAREIEYLYVLDGALEAARERLERLAAAGEPVAILQFPRAFGRAAALSVAFREAKGDVVLTLPPEGEVETEELPKLVAALARADLVVAARQLEDKPASGRIRKLEWLARLLLGNPFTDLRCRVRLMRRAVADELVLYGNQDRFLPLLAQSAGFRVVEVPVRGRLVHAPSRGADPGMLLDLLTVFFLFRFVQKPFRFFGGIGLGLVAAGGLGTAWLVLERLAFGTPLANRPALILATLTLVLGIQIVAVGLIGEIVAFAHARSLRRYRIERIVE